jgi:ABC-type nickel/cobalt efflux system permease component RcnA
MPIVNHAWLWRLVVATLALLPMLMQTRLAAAHPLGNFSVNRYSRIEVHQSQVRVTYVVDRAEIPAFQERAHIDSNSDGALSQAEQQAYLAAEVDRNLPKLNLMIGGKPAALHIENRHIEFPAGQGGLNTQRITTKLIANLPTAQPSQPLSLQYTDQNFASRLGWQEIVVVAGEGIVLSGDNVPTQDISNELRNYPQGLLQSPLQRSSVSFGFVVNTKTTTDASNQTTASNRSPVSPHSAARRPSSTADRFAALINFQELTLGTALIALAGAFIWGAAHALSPGHGKTIVAAYLVGQRATAKHAIFLGATTTLTHTAGVFSLGLITLFFSQFILPEQLYPWLEVVSGALVVVLGVTLLRGRIAGLLKVFQVSRVSTVDKVSNAHSHDDHSHIDPTQPHDHGDGFVHSHAMPQSTSWRSLLALGVSGGLLPCPSALVVMLSAIALQRVGFGLLLTFVFSLGLAGVLIAIGLALVYGTRFTGQLMRRLSASRWAFAQPLLRHTPRLVPVFSAAVITLAGLAITWRALLAAGVVG